MPMPQADGASVARSTMSPGCSGLLRIAPGCSDQQIPRRAGMVLMSKASAFADFTA
jgi:hypothetical protein